jgi:hypothetical protein
VWSRPAALGPSTFHFERLIVIYYYYFVLLFFFFLFRFANPLFSSSGEENGILRQYGVDIAEIHSDQPGPIASVSTADRVKKRDYYHLQIPQQTKRLKSLLAENGQLLLHVQLYKNWYTDEELSADPKYTELLQSVQTNLTQALILTTKAK